MNSSAKGKMVDEGSGMQNQRDPFISSWKKQEDKVLIRYEIFFSCSFMLVQRAVD